MSFSPKKYHEKLYKTIEAINNKMYTGTFINNPGFGSIFSILKDPKFSESLHNILNKYYSEDRKQNVIKSLESASRTSYYTPVSIMESINKSINTISGFTPNSILEPSAGNGAWIKELQKQYPTANYTAFEKDILSAQIFEHNFKFDNKVTLYGLPYELSSATDAPQKYDLVVSNIPFAQNRVFDPTLAKHPQSKAIQSSLHSYFTYKATEQTNINGVTAILSTKSMMDSPKHEKSRRAITDSSNFIGAVRLPKKTFSAENTPVITDVMFFQKRENNNNITADQEDLNNSFVFSNNIELDGANFPISTYFLDHPDHIIGTIEIVPSAFGKSISVLSDLEIDEIGPKLEDIISKDFKFQSIDTKKSVNQQLNLTVNQKNIEDNLEIENTPSQKIPPVTSQQQIEESLDIEEISDQQKDLIEKDIASTDLYRVGPGSIIIHQQKVVKIQPDASYEYLNIKPAHYDPYSKIIHMRNQAFIMLNNPTESAYKKAQDELNATYTSFNFTYGSLNETYIADLVATDTHAGIISSFEKIQQGQFVQGTIFSAPYKQTLQTQTEKKSTREQVELNQEKDNSKTPQQQEKVTLLSLENAVLLSLNQKGRIDLDIIRDNTGLSNDQILIEGLDNKLLYLDTEDPENIELVTAQKFKSGMIYKKINFYKDGDFKDYEQYLSPEYKASIIQQLEAIKPAVTKWEELNVLLHENWFPTDIVSQFIEETYASKALINYSDVLSKYMVKMESVDRSQVGQFYVRSEHRSYNFNKILEAALNQTIPRITKGSKDHKKIDKAKMTEVKVKMQMIYSDFNNYVNTHPALKKKLEKAFYETYEGHVKPKYDGSYLQYKGLNKFIPHDYQNDTTSGIIQNEGLLVNMEVGFGKTLTMALSAMKMREVGIVKKNLVIALNSTVIQLGNAFKEAFPQIKILVLTDKNAKGPQKRTQAFNQISKYDYDIVLMSHDAFSKIPQDPKVEAEIIENTIDDLTRDLSVIYDNKYDINSRLLKGLETRKDNLNAKLKELQYKLNDRKDDSMHFGKMGIDHIMVDESHFFKNLAYTTRHNRVGGLNSPIGSQRSSNLLTAIRTLQKKKGKDFQATFLSGTPISNSVTEAYVIFKYLIPNKLKELNIQSFDQWAQMFAEKSYDFEPTLDGSFKIKERFRKFKKLKLLSSLYNDVGIVVNNKTHQIDRPKAQIKVQEIVPTSFQEEYFTDVAEFLNNGDPSLLLGDKVYDEDQKSAASLIANHHLRTASIDPRLLDQNLEDPGDNKLRTIAKEVAQVYNDTSDFKGTQAIFSDIGTPKERFNVYDEIKRILVEEENLPEEKIQFIHSFDKNDKVKREFNQKVNDGDFRIVIGSTQKLGTGTNIQKRLIEIHNVDIPYRSTDIDQRSGRGERPGNIFAKSHYDNRVGINFYITKKSVDAVLLNHVNTKKTFIDQITNGTIQYNNIDMGSVDDSGNIDYKSMMAIANDNPLYMEKKDLSQIIEDLQLEKNIILRNQNNAKSVISYQYDQLDIYKRTATKLNKDMSLFNQTNNETHYKDIKLISEVKGKTNFNNPEDLGKAIQKLTAERQNDEGTHKIAEYKEATLFLDVSVWKGNKLSISSNTGIQYNYGSKDVVKNPESVGKYIQKSFAKIPNLLEKYDQLYKESEVIIESNQKIKEISFSKDDLLKETIDKYVVVKEKLETIEAEKEARKEASQEKAEEEYDKRVEDLKDEPTKSTYQELQDENESLLKLSQSNSITDKQLDKVIERMLEINKELSQLRYNDVGSDKLRGLDNEKKPGDNPSNNRDKNNLDDDEIEV